MQTTLFLTARTSALRALATMETLLDKAVASAEARKFEPSVLLASRLAPDMFPLLRQFQIACDFCKGPMARLSAVENPKFEDAEVTVGDLKARIARTREFVAGIPEASFEGAEQRDIVIQAGSKTLEFKGFPYLVGFAIPNLHFHLGMAYAILRHNGVDVGKRDFIGPA